MKNTIVLPLLIFMLSACSTTAQIKNFHTANITIKANCDHCAEIIEKAGFKKKEAEVNWDGASKTAHIIYDSKKTTLDEVLKRIAYAGFDTDKFRAPDQAYNALPECCRYNRTELVAVVPQEKDPHAHHKTDAAAKADEHAGHDMPASDKNPQQEAPKAADPHKGHTAVPAKAADPHKGHTTAQSTKAPEKAVDPHKGHTPATAKAPAKQTDPHKDHTPAPTKAPAKPTETAKPAAQTEDLMSNVYTQYFALKDALVKDDAKTAAAKAGALEKAISAVPMNKMSTAQHDVWMKIYKNLAADAGRIAKESTVAKQRQHFATLSANMHQLTKVFKPAETVYYQHCPMYKNNMGANWLSKESTVKNPYYGPSMLSCGKTVETIK